MQPPQVKGVWFVTARRYIVQEFGEAKLHAVSRALAEQTRPLILEPLASAWYHEDVFQEMLRAVMSEIAHGDSVAFSAFIEGSTVLGVNSFFRVLMRITSVKYLMHKMPVLSKQYRRNDSTCTVDASDTRAVLKWTNMPYFGDRNYRLYTVAMLAKTAELCTNTRPKVAVLEYGDDRFSVQVTYR